MGVRFYNNVFWILLTDLFAESLIRGKKSVALAVDGWVCASPNGVHLPMGVVIVDHMEVAMPTSANVKSHPKIKITKNSNLLIKQIIWAHPP